MYEVGYDYAYECVLECKYYYDLEEATKAFNYLENEIKQLANENIHPYIHKCETRNAFEQSDFDIKEKLKK